jgi:uncharacterized protein (TIGR02996 family)
MLHPAEFWDAILTRPHDDEPRLRYADWLSRRDQPLADFIRLQCRLAQESAEHGNGLVLERRQHQLMCEHSTTWAGLLADHVAWWSFRRGFVEEVEVTAGTLADAAPHLFQHAPLQDLHLTLDGADLDDLPRVDGLDRTVFLDLSAHPLGDAGLIELAHAPFLNHVHGLNLTSCGLCGSGLQALGESPHSARLRELYLCDNIIDDAGIRQFVMTPLLERLEVLYLRVNLISEEAAGLLQRILGDRVHL